MYLFGKLILYIGLIASLSLNKMLVYANRDLCTNCKEIVDKFFQLKSFGIVKGKYGYAFAKDSFDRFYVPPEAYNIMSHAVIYDLRVFVDTHNGDYAIAPHD